MAQDDTVVFTISDRVPEAAEDAVIAAVGFVEGVAQVQRLMPDSTLPALRRMGVVSLTEPGRADPQVVAERIRALPGIAHADVPPARGPG